MYKERDQVPDCSDSNGFTKGLLYNIPSHFIPFPWNMPKITCYSATDSQNNEIFKKSRKKKLYR